MSFARNDERLPDQLRMVRITPDFMPYAEGSALIEMGNTRVICTASLEDRVPSFLRNTGQGWVTAEYSMLPRSTLTRTQRESGRNGVSGRTQEIQRLIGRSLRAVADLNQLGERTLTASITGAYVAFAVAVKRLMKRGVLNRNPITGSVAAVSVGIVEGVPVLDLKYDEDSRAEVDMNVVCTGDGRFVELQGTAEGMPFNQQEMDALLSLARKGIDTLLAAQRDAIERSV
jgi:ribonuclease PH